ncbi:MAG: hypothetical protein JO303_02900 [Caulobacteraceae bacterium]|nr:hypothetical protein [Caulobacteraceae bacterium]
MRPFIDLVGASGAVYRFRRFEQGQVPATGGAFAYVQEDADGLRVLGLGKARTLAHALAGAALRREAEGELYLRLNVVAAAQDSEYEDLTAALPEPFVRYESE